MAMSYPFLGDIYYEVEASYKAGFSGTQLRISDAIQDVRIETGDINTELMSISQASLVAFSKTMVDPTLHIEWVLQPHAGDSLVSNCWTRANCDLDSMSFEIPVNECSGSVVSAFHYLKGCKCKSFNVKASSNENWIISADFSVASLETNLTRTGTKPGALGTAYAAFNTAGDITWTGVTGAYVTQGFDFTVDNNLTDHYDVGSVSKTASIPGAISITGSCDISIDDGGTTHFDEVIAGTDITSLVLNTGITTATYNNGKFTLSGGRFDSSSIDLNTSGGGIISSVPFTFKTLAIAIGT